MLLPAIALDSAMSASEALERLALYGIWADPQHPAAKSRIERHANRTRTTFDDAARRLARAPWTYGAAIRRQWYANVLWYSRPVAEVLSRCLRASSGTPLIEALNLHEPDSRPPVDVPEHDDDPVPEGVVIEGGVPWAVSTAPAASGQRATQPGRMPVDLGTLRSITTEPEGSELSDGSQLIEDGATAARRESVSAWPRVEAPDYIPARKQFDVTVGFATTKQEHVIGGPVALPVPSGTNVIDVDVELISDGLDALDGWSKRLRVDVRNPTAALATFRFVGRDPTGPEPVHLTTIDVRYVVHGDVCGTATRPLVVGAAGEVAAPAPVSYGSPWLAQPAAATRIELDASPVGIDLTIEIAKPDGNASTGRYVCRLYSPHPIAADRGPHDMDLGQEAKSFAKSIVEEVRAVASDPFVENVLASEADLITDMLPAEAIDALREVGAIVAPNPPTVLIVSADPYVPWELARIDPPLFAELPPYLGAQAVVGRWLRIAPKSATTAAGVARPRHRPPPHPPYTIDVQHMAVMAGMYKEASGLARLPMAEEEASALAKTYDAIPLAASLQSLKHLLDATLEHHFAKIGGAGAVHFAGHGDFDPTRPDASTLYLSDGRPLSSLAFRSANYGGDGQPQPLIFLNACMIGIGGEILGAAGGFPGNCLAGGFGAVLGALWEVNDVVARDVALEFWRRALPTDGTKPESIGVILRDIRSKFVSGGEAVPVATYLSYVYYGHPCLTLQRTA